MVKPTAYPNGIQAPLLDKTGASIAVLTDSSGGTADNTVAASTGTYNATIINNNFADLTAKINALLDRS